MRKYLFILKASVDVKIRIFDQIKKNYFYSWNTIMYRKFILLQSHYPIEIFRVKIYRTHHDVSKASSRFHTDWTKKALCFKKGRTVLRKLADVSIIWHKSITHVKLLMKSKSLYGNTIKFLVLCLTRWTVMKIIFGKFQPCA